MFIVAKRNILLPSADGSQVYPVKRGYVGYIPDWAADTPYFAALVKDGKIGTPESKKDKDIAHEEEKPVEPPAPADDAHEDGAQNESPPKEGKKPARRGKSE